MNWPPTGSPDEEQRSLDELLALSSRVRRVVPRRPVLGFIAPPHIDGGRPHFTAGSIAEIEVVPE